MLFYNGKRGVFQAIKRFLVLKLRLGYVGLGAAGGLQPFLHFRHFAARALELPLNSSCACVLDPSNQAKPFPFCLESETL